MSLNTPEGGGCVMAYCNIDNRDITVANSLRLNNASWKRFLHTILNSEKPSFSDPTSSFNEIKYIYPEEQAAYGYPCSGILVTFSWNPYGDSFYTYIGFELMVDTGNGDLFFRRYGASSSKNYQTAWKKVQLVAI